MKRLKEAMSNSVHSQWARSLLPAVKLLRSFFEQMNEVIESPFVSSRPISPQHGNRRESVNMHQAWHKTLHGSSLIRGALTMQQGEPFLVQGTPCARIRGCFNYY